MGEVALQEAKKMEKLSVKERMKIYETKVVASIFHNKEAMDYVLKHNIDYRFFPTYMKIMKIFHSLASGTVVPSIELVVAQLNLSTDAERMKMIKLLEGLKEKAVGMNEFLIYLKLLKKQYKINRYYEFAKMLQERIEQEKINPIDSDFEKLNKEIDFMFSKLLEEYSHSDRIDVGVLEGYEKLVEELKQSLHTDKKQTVTTGYEEVDRVFNGGHLKGTYTVIAGRPGMGKSVYMLNEAVESSKKGTKNVFISIEMNSIQCFQRIIAKVAGIKASKLQDPKRMTSDDWKKLKNCANEIAELLDGKLWIVEVTELNTQRLKRIIQEYKRKYDIDSVYVDYVQIMNTDKGEKPEQESDYASISEGLRKLAKSEDIAVIVGSQLSRNVENREDKRPRMSDLRNSGAFEQDAVRVIGLYRDEYYNPDTEEPGVLEYIILKNRFGASNVTIKFKYDVEKQDIFPKAS